MGGSKESGWARAREVIMAKDKQQTKSVIKTIAVYLAVIAAVMLVLVPAGLIWESQAALDRHHLTQVGVMIMLWKHGEQETFGSHRRGTLNWVGDLPDLTLTPAAASFLGKTHRRTLHLSLRHLSPDVAKGLSHSDNLNLTDLESVPPEALKELMSGQSEGSILHIRIPNMTRAQAEALASYKGLLNLYGNPQLSPEAAQGLSQLEANRLDLIDLKQLSTETAQALSRCRVGHLNIKFQKNYQDDSQTFVDSRDSIPREAALALSQSRAGSLSIGPFNCFCEETAVPLRQYPSSILLRALIITDEAAMALAQSPGFLWISGLKYLSEDAAHALAGKEKLLINGTYRYGPHDLSKLYPTVAAILEVAENNSNGTSRDAPSD